MKTTMEISDELLIDAKKTAAELRRPLRGIVEEALRRELERIKQRRRGEGRIQWVTVDGGLPPGMDLRNRESMAEWLKQEKPIDRD
jgi:hypothetical protein